MQCIHCSAELPALPGNQYSKHGGKATVHSGQPADLLMSNQQVGRRRLLLLGLVDATGALTYSHHTDNVRAALWSPAAPHMP